MLARVKRLKVPLTTFLASETTHSFIIEDKDWAQLDYIILLLKPLDDMTNYLSKSRFPSISTVIPSYVACIEEIKEVAASNPAFLSAQAAIELKLDFYYQAAFKKSVYATSTILDPRFKHIYFKGRRDSTSIKKQFLKDAEPYSKYSVKSLENEQTLSSSNNITSASSPTWINRMFKKNKQSSLDEEVKTYLAGNISPEHTDPIHFWSASFQKDHFPCLSMMAKSYFSVPATSTPSERSFSGGRLICHHTRGSLSAEKLCSLMCLNSWLKNGYIFRQ
jgi:hypothetical protein